MKRPTISLDKLKKAEEKEFTLPPEIIPPQFNKYRPKYFVCDTETTGLNWSKNARPFGISLAWRDAEGRIQTAWYEYPVDPYTRQPIYGHQHGINYLNDWMRDPTILKVGAHFKFDRHMLKRAFNVTSRGPQFDVLIAAWCCNTMEESYKLNDLFAKYSPLFDLPSVVKPDTEKNLKAKVQVARNKAKKLGYNFGAAHSITWEDYWAPRFIDHNDKTCQNYGVEDAVETLLLFEFYREGIKELGVEETFNIEMQVSEVIYQMEERGIRFFEDDCKELVASLKERNKIREDYIKTEFNKPGLNIASSQQLIPLIYNTEDSDSAVCLGYTPIEFTGKTQQPSTSLETFKKLLQQKPNPVLQTIVDCNRDKQGTKAFDLYIKKSAPDPHQTAWDIIGLNTFRSVHASFNQIGISGDKQHKARTGRLTSSDPNLQNVSDPLKSGVSVDARRAFGPRNGYVWYCIDYSQLELRIFAERTGGQLKDAFLLGRDPHNETREAVPYLAGLEKGEGRKKAKNTNFTIINCGGPYVLWKKYQVPMEEGKIIIREFKQNFPETVERQKEAEKFAINHGYIETLCGRRINVDLSTLDDYGRPKYAYRATSYDIQGSAADFIKRAMLATTDFLSSTRYDAHLVLSIHDELVFEVAKDHSFKHMIRTLKKIMEDVGKPYMSIPLECEVQKTVTNWSSEAKVDVVLYHEK